MVINSFDDLMKTVEERRKDTLSLEVDLGGEYSQEHEDAKSKLKQAEAMQLVTGQNFLSDNLDQLKQAVEDTRPPANVVLIKFGRVKAMQWAALMKNSKINNALDQFDHVLPDVFGGIFNTESDVPLTTDHKFVSPSSDKCILPGGALQSMIQAFMSWQNSGGEVTYHPEKSGHV